MKITLKEIYLNEIDRKKSLQYYRDLKMRDPKLFRELENFASALVRFHRRDTTPKELVDPFTVYLNKHKEVNPFESPDTVGIKMFVDVLAQDKKEARTIKKYFDSLFNALLKKRYKGRDKQDKESPE